MCGICGLYDKHMSAEEKKNLVMEMNHAQKHRGPDDEGIYIDENVGLGHVRLSIIDLSQAGHQPMTYGDRYTIIFNGEIYNYIELRSQLEKLYYQFDSETDTEVLLAAYDCWGEKCQEKLNGFWAFAIYDHLTGALFLSRDRYGVKPLYYTNLPGYFLFASEIKAILKSPDVSRFANDQAVLDYLVNGFVDCEEETFFQGIYRLPAGSCMTVQGDEKPEVRKYYCLDYQEADGTLDHDMTKRFRSLFQNSIRLRLRADVPVGSCLSGGLDSSAIVCECSRQLKRKGSESVQKTYSACYKDSPNDESQYIEEVLRETGVQGFTCYPTAESLKEDLDHLIYTQDEPFLSTSMYASYCVMRLAHQKGAKVLLDGQGADEMLCGYRKARVYYIKKLIENKNILPAIREAVLYFPYMRKHNSSLLADMGVLLQFLGKKKKHDEKRKYLREKFASARTMNSYENNERFLVNDFEKIVLPALLRYTDRNSMAFSIEDRLPFLDYRLVDFTMKLPLNAKIHGGYSKYIMRKALDMPKKIRIRKDKIGFYTPEQHWLAQYSDEYKALFAGNDVRTASYIDCEKLVGNWDRLITGKDNIGLFRYICLEKWMRIFDVKSVSEV